MITSGSGISYFFGNTVINHALRSASIPGSICRMGLFRYIDETFTGSSASEVGLNPYYFTGYERLDLSGSWTISACKATMTTSSAAFPPCYHDWGSIYAFGVGTGSGMEDLGNIYFYGRISPCRYVNTDCIVFVKTGNLHLTLSGYEEYLANNILEHYLNDVNYPSPNEDVYISLYRTNNTEITGSVGYCRIPWGGSGSWAEPIAGSTMNTGSLIFTQQAPLDWGTIKGIMIYDSGSGGNLLFKIPLSGSVNIKQNDSFIIETGKLKIYTR